MTTFLGLDPGNNGCIAALHEDGSVCAQFPLKNATPQDIATFVRDHKARYGIALCALEKVGSMPGEGHAGAFTFGASWGLLLGILVTLQIPYCEPAPGTWQRKMGCIAPAGSKWSKTQKKNRNKEEAQKRWPGTKFTHATADATLLAEYARNDWRQR